MRILFENSIFTSLKVGCCSCTMCLRERRAVMYLAQLDLKHLSFVWKVKFLEHKYMPSCSADIGTANLLCNMGKGKGQPKIM